MALRSCHGRGASCWHRRTSQLLDTYADAHVSSTAIEAGATSQLSRTHIFTSVAIETAGTWQHQAVEFVHELGRWATSKRQPACS